MASVSPMNGAEGTLTLTLGVGAAAGLADACLAGVAASPNTIAAMMASLMHGDGPFLETLAK